MTNFAKAKSLHIERLEHELVFKEAAFRYCNHSKKREKLWQEIEELHACLDFLEGRRDDI